MNTEFNLFVGLSVGDSGQVTLDQGLAEMTAQIFLDGVVPGWTITTGKGCWGGMTEPAMIITIFADLGKLIALRKVAKMLKLHLGQQTVLLTYSPVYAEEI